MQYMKGLAPNPQSSPCLALADEAGSHIGRSPTTEDRVELPDDGVVSIIEFPQTSSARMALLFSVLQCKALIKVRQKHSKQIR